MFSHNRVSWPESRTTPMFR